MYCKYAVFWNHATLQKVSSKLSYFSTGSCYLDKFCVTPCNKFIQIMILKRFYFSSILGGQTLLSN